MSDVSIDDDKDFEVVPALGNSVQDFTEAFVKLRDTLKPTETKPHINENENHTEVLIRMALGAVDSKSVLFRKNDSAEQIKIQAWLSIVSEKAKEVLIRNSLPIFDEFSVEDLKEVSRLSLDPGNLNKVAELLANTFGIVLIVEQGFKAMKMDGCVFTLSQGTPVIGISLRFNRYDNFWFTLMHELAHICLHYEQLDQPILDDLAIHSASDIEVEANIIAKDSLVSRQYWRLIWNARDEESLFIEQCAKAEVHLALAAGLIRHETGNYKLFKNYLNIIDVRNTFGFNDV